MGSGDEALEHAQTPGTETDYRNIHSGKDTATEGGVQLGVSQFSDLAVLVDVGGVLLMPDHALLNHAATTFGGTPATESELVRAHYLGVAAGDGPGGFDWAPYRGALLTAAGVAPEHLTDADAVLAEALAGPADTVWSQVLPGAREAMVALVGSGARVAIVSNSDGTVAASLRSRGLLADGTPVLDSGAVGISKPDPGIFLLALEALGVPPERAFHVGDVPSVDVVGARAAGVRPLHLDPLGWCRAGDHEHVAGLGEVPAVLAT